MRRVAQFFIGPYPLELWFTNEPIDAEDPDGVYDSNVRPRRIVLHDRVQGAERSAVLIHELTHASLDLLSVDLGSLEELICDVVALGIAEAIGFPAVAREVAWTLPVVVVP